MKVFHKADQAYDEVVYKAKTVKEYPDSNIVHRTSNIESWRAFCRMNRRVMVCSEVKARSWSRSESESEEGDKLHAVDPKPCDLPMDRVKVG